MLFKDLWTFTINS